MRPPRSAHYALLAGVVAAIALVGYLGYVFYPRFDLPAGTGAGLFLLALAAAVASFFSPCSFPLLLSVLARQPAQASALASAARFASALALGAAAFVLLLGAAIAGGSAAAFGEVTFSSPAGRALRVTLGALLILLGLIQLGRLRIPLRRYEPATRALLKRQATLRRRRPFAGYALFGFAYLLAGLG